MAAEAAEAAAAAAVDERPAGLGALGVGIGWRPQLTALVDADRRLFLEVIAENVDPGRLPDGLARAVDEDRPVIPHGIRLSLGGAEHPDPRRLEHLSALAERVRAPFVSEHIAFARAHGIEAGHVLPVERTHEALEIIAENVALAQERLPVPLALEHVAALVQWPDAEMSETRFINELLERTGAMLLLDLSNLFANATNHRFDAVAALDELPLERIAYVHVGGGVFRDGRYHDTHADPVIPEVLALVEELCARTAPAGVVLERDDAFPTGEQARAELEAIERAAGRGAARRATVA